MNRDNGYPQMQETSDSGWKAKLKGIWRILPLWVRELSKPVGVYAVIVMAVVAAAKILGVNTGDLLNAINILTGLFTTVLAAMTWFNVQMLRSAKPGKPGKAGQGSAIVIIDIGTRNIEGDVFAYCEKQDLFKEMLHGNGFRDRQAFGDINSQISGSGYQINDIGENRRVVILSRAAIENTEESARQIYLAFGWLERALHKNGISDLHIFYLGPVVIPFYIGDLLSNRFNVYIYKYLGTPGNGTYTFSGMMNYLQYMEKK